MKPITVHLDRYERMHGWANRLLRVDLSEMRVWAQEAAPYVPAYLGARGIAAGICWDEYPKPVDPFSPANPLMVITGALTGSRAPYAGRTTVHAFSPQASPYPWFTRSSIGGRFGGELKRAGYDGIVVTGASETPVQVRIRDDEVSILPADGLWGLDIVDTLETLESAEGKGVRSLIIGPTGERLSRIAVIQTGSSSSAGQGGFGAVMGSKRLKAITVRGTGRVSLAAPETMTSLTRELARRFREAGRDRLSGFGRNLEALNRELVTEGNGRARRIPCTEGCLTPCNAYFQDMPGAAYGRKWSGRWFCISEVLLPELLGFFPSQRQALWDWRLERRAGFEINVLSNRYGLNQYDLLMGIVPWLVASQKEGAISALNGHPMDWSSPRFWAAFLRATAYREGLGDVLAEGGWIAAQTLHIGQDIARTLYPGWGHAGHWDGHTEARLSFPHWLVSALQWLSDTRDPFSSGRSSLWPNWATRGAFRLAGEEREAALDKIRAIGQHLYGSADAVDPYGGYGGKASMGRFHTVRPVILDCVPVDVYRFPLIHDANAPDRFWRLNVEGIGEIEGPSVEYHLFRAGTGLDWPEAEFERAAEGVVTMERALQVRHWGRDRRLDESILPYFERLEFSQSPYLEKRYGLDREQFAPVLDEFYALHGWDPQRGWPMRERLAELDMGDVYGPMVDGATKAQQSSPGVARHG
jgi:aldehyde:ferredoxin oxidoreductase